MSQDPPVQSPSSPEDFATFIKSRCIGLTGGIATGKTTVANMLRQKGYLVIDADQIARQIVAPGEAALDAIIQHFGSDILLANPPHNRPELDREKLRNIIMASTPERKALEAITHPAIHQKFKQIVDNSGILNLNQIFFYEASLIFEMGRAASFHKTWATFCSPMNQLNRLQTRSKLTTKEAESLVATQIPAIDKAQMATVAIDTDVSMDALQAKIHALTSAL
jgi:dephospho-CoA kinase